MSIDYSFTAEELACMRATQTGHMLDRCVVLSFTEGTRNEYNEDDAPSYPAGEPVECGLNMNPGSRRFGEDMTVIQYDAILRLPLGAALKETDHIQIVARFGENIDPLIYEIVSPIQRGPSGIRIYLRKLAI